MSWKWERPLVHVAKAKLVVESTEWSVEAYFPGPDSRYSGTFWRLPAAKIDSYAQELKNAWRRLEELEIAVPGSTGLSVDGAMNIKIIVSGWQGRGITLHQHHGLLRSQDQVDKAAAELNSLQDEAREVQRLLSGK